VKQRAGYLMDKGENEIFLNQDENKILFEVIEQSIEYLNFQMDKVEKELYTIVKSDELMKNQFELITSIKGVGKLTALFMIAFTHCFTSFDNWRQFASYAGTAPFPYRSGTSIKGKNKVSNLANKRLKTLLNMCARSAIVCNPEMKIYFQNRKAKGENGMSAINIIRNKLLSRIFAVIKRGTPYVNTLKYAA
jgi:transposase